MPFNKAVTSLAIMQSLPRRGLRGQAVYCMIVCPPEYSLQAALMQQHMSRIVILCQLRPVGLRVLSQGLEADHAALPDMQIQGVS